MCICVPFPAHELILKPPSGFATHSRVSGFIQYEAAADDFLQERVAPGQALGQLFGSVDQQVQAEQQVELTADL